MLKTLKKCSNILVFYTLWLVICKLLRIWIQLITLMRIRIQLISFMRIRILPFNLIWIRIHNTAFLFIAAVAELPQIRNFALPALRRAKIMDPNLGVSQLRVFLTLGLEQDCSIVFQAEIRDCLLTDKQNSVCIVTKGADV